MVAFKNAQRSVLVPRGQCEDLVPLKSDHEEADTRLLLHVKQAYHERNRIVIQSPDTYVAILCTTYYSNIQCLERLFQTGVQGKASYVPIHSLAHELGPECAMLYLAFT